MEPNISIDEAKVLQAKLADRVEDHDRFSEPPCTIGGADVAYDEARGLAAGVVAVLDATSHKVIEIARAVVPLSFPYVPGLFSFRETPPLLAAWDQLDTKPDILICDGHGRVHPRRFGMACHLGVLLDTPTIGCAKRPLIGKFDPPGPNRGDYSLIVDGEEELGVTLRTQTEIKPVYVSTGHRVSLESAIRIVLSAAASYRQPDTTRVANEQVNAYLANNHSG